MGDLAQLLLGIAAIITASGSATAGIIVAVRGSKKERKRAAAGVLDRLLGEDEDEDDGDRQEAVIELLGKIVDQQRGDES